MAHVEGQQHPISVYLWIWGALFVFSFFSYMVDYLAFQGMLRWSLILLFIDSMAGSQEGFKYKKAMVEAGKGGLTWSVEKLDEFLTTKS